MSRPARPLADLVQRGSFVTWFTFLAGIPMGMGILYFILEQPYADEVVKRYVHHPVEQAEVVLFCCAMAALLAKVLVSLKERYVQSQSLLPNWDGKPLPISDIGKLQQAIGLIQERIKSTFIGRRIVNILNFIDSRGSANELDDQMRTLADNDAIALEGSYELMRFINWSIPILGTVLGITAAIGGITPEALEKGLNGVTDGLTNAFDATALGLSLTMVSMFFNYLVGRLEQGLLERVDLYVDEHLAHRFLRTGPEQAPTPVRELHQLLDKQVALWNQSVSRIEQQWAQTAVQQQEKLATVLQQALDATLTRFAQRMLAEEKKQTERHQALIDGLGKAAATIKDGGREHQLTLARLTDAVGQSVETLTKLQTNEAQLNRLQDALSQNLVLLANSATFEQAVESLTAAIHLLTTRVNPAAGGPRVLPLQKGAA
jgi:biopolymer transport protein ExbB/TolQ